MGFKNNFEEALKDAKIAIYKLSGTDGHGKEREMMSCDVRGLQIVFTTWLRAGGNGFIWRVI